MLINLGTAFTIGFIASLSTCMAMVGGLLLSMSANFAKNGRGTRSQIFFHAGRLVAFFVLGGVIGMIGSAFTLTATMTTVLAIVISLIMLVLGINLLGVFSWANKLWISLPSSLAMKVKSLANLNNAFTPLLVGIATFFMPCGFTQSMQIYTLSTGNFMAGALTMLFFALGTLPVLALISFGSLSLGQGPRAQKFFKIAGVVVIIFALFNLVNAVTGGSIYKFINKPTVSEVNNVRIVDGVQIIEIDARGGYYPNKSIAQAGLPTVIRFKTQQTFDCSSAVKIPSLNILKTLPQNGETDIDIGSLNAGTLDGSCGMGMYPFEIEFVGDAVGEIVGENLDGEADPSRMTLDMTEWRWQKATYNDGRTVTPKQPNIFKITFTKDGNFSAMTDCNRMSGTYSVTKNSATGNLISFGPIAMTKMYCEGSQENEFASFLQNASEYQFTSRGELIIGLKFDSGSVIFR